MKYMKIILINIIFVLMLTLFIGEIWALNNKGINQGLDRILHPYIGIGGFYKGGYFDKKETMDPSEAPEKYGYFRKGFFKIPTYKYGTEIKEFGERGQFLYRDSSKKLVMPKPKDEFRIFILGGSVAFGEGAKKPENRWYLHLESELKKISKRNIVVIPAANHSHVSTQERVIYELYVAPYEPDAAIFLSGFNDANTGISGTRPGDPYGQSIIYAKDESPLYGLVNDIAKHSALIRYFLQEHLFKIWLETRTTELDKKQAESVANVFYDNVKQERRRCKYEKVKCYHYLQPYWDLTASHRGLGPFNDYDMIGINYAELMKRANSSSGVINFTDIFDKLPEKFPFIDPAHFGDEGHIHLAKVMAADLVARGIFK